MAAAQVKRLKMKREEFSNDGNCVLYLQRTARTTLMLCNMVVVSVWLLTYYGI